MERIHLSPPDMTERERDALLRAFDSNWVTTMGPEVDAFEAEVAQFTQVEAAAALASGTAALHLALLLNGVGPGDEVWISTLTFVAPVNASRYVGAEIRFVDSEPDTWNMDPDLLEEELDRAGRSGRLPKAVIAVDLYGQCAQLDRISAACALHGVVLIEDAAEALGATWCGRASGSWGELGVFSFNGNKIATTSGGGMLVGSREDIDRARYLAQQARQPVLHYEHTEVGYNYRLSNLLAAIGRAQLERLPAMIARRRAIHDFYRTAFEDIDGLRLIAEDTRGASNHWLSVMRIGPESGIDPMTLCRRLGAAEIEARPVWKPMHLQPVFQGVPCAGGKVAESLYSHGVCLPSGSGMTDAALERVATTVRAVMADA
ncbi:MAG TPA: aminotransferase class I/II-fold pyridoxal phosphate-dependent enzyme [Microthrixaceae bacterium]|nr:aminotransferase class I/II-fold pyridoxal phosphate-dependent enzyme [Microthrixaceae bacterium]